MKLSDIQAGPNYFKGIIFGPSGSGKTVAAATFPGKKLWCDFDNKIMSVAEFYKADKALLEDIEVKQYGKMSIKAGASGKPRMQTFLDDLKPLQANHSAGKKQDYDTIIVDTITLMAESILEDYRYVSQLGVKRPNQDQNSMSDYGLLGTHVKQIVQSVLSFDMNVVLLGHTQLEKDDVSGVMLNNILFPGALKDKLGIYALETYFQKIGPKGERVWQTQADQRSPFCKTVRRLPAEIPANFAEIVKAR